jgi:hypothetical protein
MIIVIALLFRFSTASGLTPGLKECGARENSVVRILLRDDKPFSLILTPDS